MVNDSDGSADRRQPDMRVSPRNERPGEEGMNASKPKKIPRLDAVIEAVKDLDPNLDPDRDEAVFSTAVVLVAAVTRIGTDVAALANFTGYTREFIAGISDRMHRAGMWDEHGYPAARHWFAPDSVGVFWADVLVALGWAEALPDGGGEFAYRAIVERPD